MNILNTRTRIPTIYGILIAIGLILYFFIMYAAGWVHIIELRLLNLFILMTGIYLALQQLKKNHRGHIDYFHAFTTGVATAAIGTAIFSVFLFFYLMIDKNLMHSIAVKEPLGFYMDPYIAAFMVSMEGLFSGIFVTFLLSNFLATRNPVPRERGHSEVIQ
jgi:hypothetical protein